MSSPYSNLGEYHRGGSNAKPGEITLAHKGVLFIDEAPEFPRYVLDALRQPLESHMITVNRLQNSYEYPADFICILAANPCTLWILWGPS